MNPRSIIFSAVRCIFASRTSKQARAYIGRESNHSIDDCLTKEDDDA